MKTIGIAIIPLFALFIIFPLFGIDYRLLFEAIEWGTKFLLPWLALYWLIRAVKQFEKLS
ncbi:hypothetical protein [Halalkalibacter sp. APA_J-10(15)]|uniref:hypothetical protein n=1 Tax=Halalkalibacter sp. APA_J-10(15) TaxID=2933805 RepID=UPI001FF4E4EC|nr:hypothetical protein [Halalkalibacter sp. APA_J-10(15)]MCK0470159.1 hypothetical protein [Halalkalibacter sp. APA_J-10(15)]